MDGVFCCFSIILLLVLSSNIAMTFGVEEEYSTKSSKVIGFIAAITDCSTRVGREEKIAMEIAVNDFYNLTSHKVSLELRDLFGNSAQAILTVVVRVFFQMEGATFASSPVSLLEADNSVIIILCTDAAIDLMKKQELRSIVSTSRWHEATLVNEISDSGEVPIVSLATTAVKPVAGPVKARSVIHMGHDIYIQMRCIAAIIEYFQWPKVTVIYEDRNSYTSDLSIITLFSNVLQNVGVELEHYLAFPVLSSLLDPKTTIQEELKKVIDRESRVFVVVQASLPFTTLLFEQTKQMGMMDRGNVWIISDGVTSLIDSFSSSLITSMEGVLGFKEYFSESAASFKEFKAKFRKKFQSEYPDEEEKSDPSIFALRAYDAIFAIVKSMERKPDQKWISKTLLSNILSSKFEGLSGEIHFMNHRLMQIPTFRIVNILGKSYREMGFWSPKFGFSKNLVKHDILKKAHRRLASAEVLDSMYWPGGKTLVPTGLMKSFLPQRVFVPVNSSYSEFVHSTEKNTSQSTGLAIDVFREVLERLPYSFPYEFVPFIGSYDAMVENVYQKAADAAIGDIEITAERCKLVEFSQPYIDSGLVMLVPTKSDNSEEGWVFLKPFTMWMWFLIAEMSVFTGFVVWLIEHRTNDDFSGPPMQQVGNVLWFSFTTLYLGQRDSLNHNLSRLVMGPWLFLILIVSASFTANLTSMITTSRLVPSPIDIGYLRRTNAAVGCDGSPLSQGYLRTVLRFKAENIILIASTDEYAEALTSGRIKAAFLLSPYAKVFLGKYCKGFTLSGPTYKLGGFGFVFPKNSPLALDFSQAIQNLTEHGSLRQLEEDMLAVLNCSVLQPGSTGDQSLGPAPFSGLFILTGIVSAIALLVTITGPWINYCQIMTNVQATFMNTRIWQWSEIVLARQSPGRVKPSEGNNVLQLGETTP